MGYYVNHETLGNTGKAQKLIDNFKAVEAQAPHFSAIPEDKALVCVVENGPFDAVALAFSEQEMKEFMCLDGRKKTWLYMDKKLAHKLSGYKEERNE